MALQGFVESEYLAAKLAALQADPAYTADWTGKTAAQLKVFLANAGFTPEQHYQQYGWTEGLGPNALFDPAEYKLAKAIDMYNDGLTPGNPAYGTVAEALAAFEAAWPFDPYLHYTQYGFGEGINPSNDFDQSAYLAAKLAALQADPDTADDWAGKTPEDLLAALVSLGLSPLSHYVEYGKDEGIPVEEVPIGEQVDPPTFGGVPGDTFTLTTGQDTFIGTANNDTFLAIDNDSASTTLTLGDVVDGGLGVDTFKLFSENDSLSLAKLNVSNVEVLHVINAESDWDDFDVAGRSFNSIILDVGGLESGGLEVDNIVSGNDVTLTNIEGDSESNYLYFKDSNADVGNVNVTVSDVDMSDDDEYFYVYSDFTAATTLNIDVTLENITDADNGYDGEFELYTDLGTTEGVEVNGLINIDNVVTDDFAVNIEIYQDGDSVNDFTVNITDSDNIDFDLEYDYDGNGTDQQNDVVTLNLDNVMNSEGDSYFYTYGAATFNVNVLSDSEMEAIGNYYTYDGSLMGDVVVNVDLQGDLTVSSFWDLNDDSGVTENTAFNVTGSGDLYVEEFDDGSSNVTVDASTATGDITLLDMEDEVVLVTTNTGDDTIEVGGFETEVSLGDGDDKLIANGYDYGDADAATLDGGAGLDTIGISDGALLDAAYAANISNFEVLDFSEGTGTYDLSIEPSLVDLSATGSIALPVTFTNFVADNTLTLTAFSDLDAITIELEDDGAADVLNVELAALDTNKDQTADGETSAVLVAEEFETINLTSSATTASVESAPGADDALTAADYVNTLDLDASDMTVLNISGDAQADVSFTGAEDLVFVDASANTAGVTVDASTGAIVGGVTFEGTEEADDYTASDNGDTIQAGGGADAINLVNLGTGEDTVRYVAQSDSVLTLTDTSTPADGVADTATGFDSITDFIAGGQDIIELSAALGLGTGDARAAVLQKGDIANVDGFAADMEAFIGDGVDFFDTNVVDRATAFATYAGTDGYLFVDANNDGDFTQADDMVIELAGVATFTVTDIQFG